MGYQDQVDKLSNLVIILRAELSQVKRELNEEKDISRQLRDANAFERNKREEADRALKLACAGRENQAFGVVMNTDYFRKLARDGKG